MLLVAPVGLVGNVGGVCAVGFSSGFSSVVDVCVVDFSSGFGVSLATISLSSCSCVFSCSVSDGFDGVCAAGVTGGVAAAGSSRLGIRDSIILRYQAVPSVGCCSGTGAGSGSVI